MEGAQQALSQHDTSTQCELSHLLEHLLLVPTSFLTISFLSSKTPVGFSPEHNVPPSLVLVQSSEGKLRSAWQAVQLSFEANRWWRLNDSSLTASFEVIGDNLYFESELDHCQKGRRLIWKRFYISPCFLCCPPPHFFLSVLWILVFLILAPGNWWDGPWAGCALF